MSRIAPTVAVAAAIVAGVIAWRPWAMRGVEPIVPIPEPERSRMVVHAPPAPAAASTDEVQSVLPTVAASFAGPVLSEPAEGNDPVRDRERQGPVWIAGDFPAHLHGYLQVFSGLERPYPRPGGCAQELSRRNDFGWPLYGDPVTIIVGRVLTSKGHDAASEPPGCFGMPDWSGVDQG